MIGSASDWFGTDLVSQCINDPICAQYVNIVAGHGYSYPHSPSGVPSAVNTWLASSGSNHLWLSETGAQAGCDTGMTSGAGAATTWAKNIHDMMTVANVSALEWWELAYEAANCNFSLTDDSFNRSKRYYVEGQWSKFIGTGWVRIDATANPANEVYVTAFKETTSGNFAIVVVNQNSAPVNVEFSLAGFPSVTSVMPTLTFASSNLEDQANVNISSDAFSYSLPATSVVTFHSTASVVAAKPTPPTNLASTVR